jgi:hypothetical protein
VCKIFDPALHYRYIININIQCVTAYGEGGENIGLIRIACAFLQASLWEWYAPMKIYFPCVQIFSPKKLFYGKFSGFTLRFISALLAAGFLFAVCGQTVYLTGTVKDSSTQKGIGGASVSLKGLPLSTVTDANGEYSLTGSSVRFPHSSNTLRYSPVFRNNTLLFGVAENDQRIRLEIYDLSGRRIASLVDEKLVRGFYRINPFAKAQAGRVYLVKIQIGDQTEILKIPYVHNQASAPASLRGTNTANNTVAKTSAVNDTLVVSAAGYATGRKAISAYTGVNDFLLAPNVPSIGTISFENGSYQSCIVPLVITVVDPDLIAATIPVQVRSTTDQAGITVPLDKLPGQTGVYSGSAFFSIVKSDSAKRLLKVGDGDTVFAFYGDVLPPALVYASTVWNGLPGNVQPKGSPISGVIHGLGITLWDSDITDSTVTIAVWSKKDTVGLRVSLARVEMSSGDYIGKIGLSLRQSRGDSVLAVGPGSDTIFMRYHDLTPIADIMGNGCLWQPMPANMFLDSAQYHGIASAMTINLTDDDVEDSTVVVTVKSATDPAGITDTLKTAGGINRYFGGSVGFTSGASAPGRISVADGDSIWVSYQEETPVRLVTQSAVWNSK